MRTTTILSLTVAAGLLASCASSGGATDDPVAPTTTTVIAATTSTTAAPATTTTVPTVPTPVTELPPVPEPLATVDAVSIVDALADPATRQSAVLAAFEAAGLPVLLADGTSLTSTQDPVGFPWSVVSSVTELAAPGTRVSLAELARTFAFADPLSAVYDADAAAVELLAGLRAAIEAGPVFVRGLVAEEARRYDGTQIDDPATTPEQVHVSTVTAMILGSAGVRAVASGLVESGEIELARGADVAGFAGDRMAAAQDLDNGCDDGVGGWGLWIGSKIAAGAPQLLPGVGLEWRGMYTELLELGKSRGYALDDELKFAEGAGKVAGVAGALLNVYLLYAQVDDRHVTATMSGDGPLVRTKTTSHGEAREIEVRIEYATGDPEQDKVRNCIYAALMGAGNNAQQAIGPAAGVQVTTSGAKGFTQNLAAGDSIVLFGPATFQPIQTADEQGRITIPVQGRAQKTDKSDATVQVRKEFSVFLEAALDPTEASQIARAFADDQLCLGALSTGNATNAAAECQNAVVDIVKQFHWDIGEFTFPLTDWDTSGWILNGGIEPFVFSALKCGGLGGTWDIYVEGQLDGGTYSGTMIGDVDEATGFGALTLTGTAAGGGFELPIGGTGTITIVETDQGASAEVTVQWEGSAQTGSAVIPLERTDCAE